MILREFRPMITADNPAPQYVSQVIRADAEHAMAVGDPERAWRDVVGVPGPAGSSYHGAWAIRCWRSAAAAARALDAGRGHHRAVGSGGGSFLEHRALQINIRPLWAAGDHRRAGGHCRRLAQRAGRADARCRARPTCRRTPGSGWPSTWSPPGSGPRRKAVLATATEQAADARRPAADRPARPRWPSGPGSRRRPRSGASPLAGLTPREIEVLQLVAAGNSNGEIGSALFISTKTASVHVSNILAKLGVSGRGEAAALAYRLGLVSV